MLEQARDSLAKAVKRMKKYSDQHRKDLEFKKGDKVMLKLTPHILKKMTDRRYYKGLIQKYDDPFEVVKRVGKIAYRLKLLDHFKVHPTFHVSFLKPFHKDSSEGRTQARRAPPTVRKQFDREIEKILDHQVLNASKKNRIAKYLV